MKNETMVENGASGEKKRISFRASVGKIARLPKEIREELNCRLDDGEPASEILPWVNELPAAKEVLAKYFRGMPINDNNLSEWRQKGFQRWQEKQESKAELTEMVENAGDFSEIAAGKLARGTASLATAKILKTLQAIPATAESLDGLTKISYAVTALLHAEQSQVRLEYEKARVCQGNERLVLSWDKFLRDCIDAVQRALTDQIAKDIQAANIDNGEKIELLGHHMFGRKWKGRAVGKKGEAKKEAEGTKKDSPKSAEEGKMDAHPSHEPVAGSPPHPAQTRTTHETALASLVSAPDGSEGEKADAHVPTGTVGSKMEAGEAATKKTEMNISGGLPTAATKGEAKKTEVQTADQQVRPTTIQGHRTEVRVSGGEKARELKVSGGLPTAATLSNLKPKAPAVELSPYDKALLEGKTHLEAMYAQYSRINHPTPKPPVDPLQPKPNPLDTFSEPVKKSPFASLHGLLRRGSLWGSTLG
jgi:hypothetical protein